MVVDPLLVVVGAGVPAVIGGEGLMNAGEANGIAGETEENRDRTEELEHDETDQNGEMNNDLLDDGEGVDDGDDYDNDFNFSENVSIDCFRGGVWQ